MVSAAPRPQHAITIGIVGHRRDRIEDMVRVKERLAEVIAMIASELPQRDASEGKTLRLVSALAEGADRIGATVASDAGVAVDVVLPFPADEYRRDFDSAESCSEFDRLLAAADCVLILDGKTDARERAYEAAGLAMLDNIDVLIAVWDGGPGRGRGGTHDVLEEAVRRNMLIVTISPDGATLALRLPQKAVLGAVRLADIAATSVDELPARIRLITGLQAQGEPEWLSDAPPPASGWAYAAYPLLLRIVGVGPKRRKRVMAPAVPPPTVLHAAFDWWDGAANAAARAFRSAVIVNFSLAALAVVLAAFSILVDDQKWIFVVIEIATIAMLLINTWYGERQKWQERWLESREVAELLRVSILLRQVGISRGVLDSEESGWSTRYVGAMARATPPFAVDLSDTVAVASAVETEIEGQAEWNEATAVRMHRAAHRIERFGEVLFVAVLGLAIAWLVLWLVNPHAAKTLKYGVTALTAGLPAIATASYGIRIILDFEGIAGRAHRLGTALRASLDQWRSNPPSAAALQAFAGQSAEAMLGDISSWRLLAEGRRLAVPG